MRTAPPLRELALASLLLFVGCERLDGDGVLVVPPCEQQAAEALHPWVDMPDAPVDALVWADLACADPSAALTLEGPDGLVAAEGSLTFAGRQVRLQPDALLTPWSLHTASLQTAVGEASWTFSTGAPLAPISASLSERSLALQPRLGASLEPPGLRDALADLLAAGPHLVLQLSDPQGASMAVRLGARQGDDPASGPVASGVTNLTAGWADPRLTLPPQTLRDTDGVVVLEGVTLWITLADDAASATARMAGLWDVRPALDAMELDDAPCLLSEEAGGDGCVPCADGAMACLPFDLRSIPARAWGGVLP